MVTLTKNKLTKVGHLWLREVTFEAPGLPKPKDWTYVKRGQFVVALVYNKAKKCFLFVKQYRIAVWENLEQSFILEAPAGLHDQMTKEDTLIKEFREELGTEMGETIVETSDVGRFYTSPGLSCELGYAFYVVIDTERSPVQFGGVAAENEHIERVEISIEKTLTMLKNGLIIDAKTQLLLYWWLAQVADWNTIQSFRNL